MKSALIAYEQIRSPNNEQLLVIINHIEHSMFENKICSQGINKEKETSILKKSQVEFLVNH